jgi:hypothetical protein
MSLENDWNAKSERSTGMTNVGAGLLRITLLFGGAAIAVSLILTSLLAERTSGDKFAAGIDTMSTGSIGPSTYTVRKSVLQPFADSVCIIRADGSRKGDC